MILRLQKTITNYHVGKFICNKIVIISVWGDPNTPKIVSQTIGMLIFGGISDTPICHRKLTVLYPFGVTSIP